LSCPRNEDSTFLPLNLNAFENDLEESLNNRNDEKKSDEEENLNKMTSSVFKAKH